MNGRRTVAVVGAGISGLSVAYELLQRSADAGPELDLLCLEAGSRPGGNIRTERDSGFVCEWGPNGFLDNAPATLQLVDRLGLTDRIVRAEAAAEKRFIYRAGKLREVATNPLRFMTSGLLPLSGKLRLLGEPFAGGPSKDDESVFEFASRRIGPQAASVLVDAMVSGVYAGDSRSLSLGSTFPKMRAMEREHGSLLKALIARKRSARRSGTQSGGPAGPAGRLTSLQSGLEELTDALADALGDRLRRDVPVAGLSDMGSRGFRVHLDEGAPLEVDAVVLACPSRVATKIVAGMDEEMSTAMAEIPSAPLAVVHLGYTEGALGDMPTGFGFLVPRGQGPRILGTLWSSQIFRGRAPEGRMLLTTMIGGAHDPGAVELADEKLVATVRRELDDIMGVAVAPFFVRVFRHEVGIPQYSLGHADRLGRIDAALARHPGCQVSGNSYRGISVNACVEEAPSIADRVVEFLRSLPEN
ncbi:MAG: protoporphyrinogen oxidase [bacterium]|nr:protoporphyrinogen oxidase [bacterium]